MSPVLNTWLLDNCDKLRSCIVSLLSELKKEGKYKLKRQSKFCSCPGFKAWGDIQTKCVSAPKTATITKFKFLKFELKSYLLKSVTVV